MATQPSSWTGEKPRKESGNGAGRGSAARSGEKVVPFRPQVLRRIFTERRRIASKRSRACSARCSSHREKRSRNASRKLTKNISTSRRTRRSTTFSSIFGMPAQAIDLITFTQVLRDRNLARQRRRRGVRHESVHVRSDRSQRRDITSRSFATNTSCAKSFRPPPRACAALTKSRTR